MRHPVLENLVEYVATIIYMIASSALFLISVLLVIYGVWEVIYAIYQGRPYVNVALDAIGLIVISMAVFDISKYLYEEHVVSDRELRSAREARETLTTFLVIIAIAVTLEALVFIFQTGSTDISKLLYPTGLLVASVFLIVGLGWYQRLSTHAETSKKKSS